ncbi:MAG: response regulator [Bacteroidales bacterium]
MKILVVENDIVSRELFRVVLEKEGYNCQFAEDGVEGLEIFNEFLPDLVISDIRMPRIDGISLLKRIRQVERNVIIIMVTAHGNEDVALEALESGANNYLKKPIDLTKFRTQIAQYKSILDKRIRKLDVSNLIQAQELQISIDSDMDYIPILAEFLTQKIKHVFSPSELINIELGISELLLNAIEHGNYNISPEEKKEALINNTLTKLYIERKETAIKNNKKIHITYSQNKEYCEWIVKDEGKGFDWRKISHAHTNPISTGLQGRGVFISKLQFDDVQFLGNGNVVSAKKYI